MPTLNLRALFLDDFRFPSHVYVDGERAYDASALVGWNEVPRGAHLLPGDILTGPSFYPIILPRNRGFNDYDRDFPVVLRGFPLTYDCIEIELPAGWFCLEPGTPLCPLDIWHCAVSTEPCVFPGHRVGESPALTDLNYYRHPYVQYLVDHRLSMPAALLDIPTCYPDFDWSAFTSSGPATRKRINFKSTNATPLPLP